MLPPAACVRPSSTSSDPASGKEAWKVTDEPASYSSPTLAEIGGKTLAVFLTRSGLLALEPETGKVRFSRR